MGKRNPMIYEASMHEQRVESSRKVQFGEKRKLWVDEEESGWCSFEKCVKNPRVEERMIKYLVMPFPSSVSTTTLRFPSTISWLGVFCLLGRKLKIHRGAIGRHGYFEV